MRATHTRIWWLLSMACAGLLLWSATSLAADNKPAKATNTKAAKVAKAPAPRANTAKAAPKKAAKAAPAAKASKQTKATKRPSPKASTPQSDEARKAQFARANKLYNAGEYGKAALLFGELAKHPGWQHFALYYNLGNSYFRLQHYGKALAFYRKAQRLRPNSTDLLHNIQLLYKRVGKSEQDQPQLRIKSLFWYYLLNLKQLFFVVIVLTYLLLLLWAVHIRRKARQTEEKSSLRWLLVGLAAILAVLWLSLGIKVYREQVRQVGVITTERVSARSGYGKHFEPMFWLSEADEVIIKEQVNVTGQDNKQTTWLRVEIRLFDKKKKRRVQQIGWIPGKALQRI